MIWIVLYLLTGLAYVTLEVCDEWKEGDGVAVPLFVIGVLTPGWPGLLLYTRFSIIRKMW